jgi:anti-sigma28 factor (negative regulator of flagellin synthesis)
MMKIPHKGRPGTDLFRLIQNDKTASQFGRDKRSEVGPTVESAEVDISKKAREPQKIPARLARKSDELLAEAVSQIKEIIAKGEYEVDPREVAQSIIRAEVSRLLEKSKLQSMNMDLMELFSLAEGRIAMGEKIAAQRGGAKEARRSIGRRRAFPTNRRRTKPSPLGFLR